MIEIKSKVECCGCSACASICPKKCIEMVEDEEGFLYPSICMDECINCDACKRVCPILNQQKKHEMQPQRAAIVQHRDAEICRESTAGGAFTAIAEYTINHGGVVFGVEMQSDYTIKHAAAESKKEIKKFRNSKYVQSFIGDTYRKAREHLDSGRIVCYSGTPCQIEGLRHFLKKDYENLILVDVVCRAVPSPGIWKKYIDMEDERYGKMSSIRFRDKTLGYQYSTMELKDVQGRIHRGGIESQPWLRMFFSGMIIRPSCTDCKFRSRYRNSDFTIWDCFNIHSIDRTFDENIGTTRMLIHSEKGQKIFEQIKSDFKYKYISADRAVNGVQEMIQSPAAHIRRDEFFGDAQELSMEELLNKFFPDTAKVRLKRNTRLLLNRFGLDKAVKHILRKG